MANSNQAKKRARQTEKRNLRNSQLRSAMRTAIKKVRKAIDLKDTKAAADAFIAATSKIDSVAGKGIIHKNTASRYKSRLAKQIKELGTKAA